MSKINRLQMVTIIMFSPISILISIHNGYAERGDIIMRKSIITVTPSLGKMGASTVNSNLGSYKPVCSL